MRKILIVDDEADVNFLFKLVLEENGFAVDSFDDPLLALQNFRAGLYDLLLLDILMPKMNGFELYQKMRILDNKVKVCFLTASGMNYEQFSSRAALGINSEKNCFINKPIENEELIKTVKMQIE